MRRSLCLASLTMLAACSPEAAEEPAMVEPSGSAPPSAPDAEVAVPRLSLQGDGVVIGTGAEALLPYGTPKVETERRVNEVLGPQLGAPRDVGTNGECGAGPMQFTRWGPLQLGFLDGKLAGWLLEDGSPIVTTDGISPGITFADLQTERSAEIDATSTLEGEFRYFAPDGGTIGGFLSGEGGSATIQSLYAGTQCFFR